MISIGQYTFFIIFTTKEVGLLYVPFLTSHIWSVLTLLNSRNYNVNDLNSLSDICYNWNELAYKVLNDHVVDNKS